ncbi:F-box domain-containing protein [Orpheovirus IHUMI-LCC2]|uniref:F-box domain-containing protein n=1 Tax=Orpheovirus IHUMI-LCC2 TaxID=2023057 RepID=A0A2I2L325_9VIRU|nr:F-box domain-containing protein [Orpheovirus IHUMI-LCC2]SNW61938.1 F-box domain-containing protein [Orpheovirus IHUMI-LCC2]
MEYIPDELLNIILLNVNYTDTKYMKLINKRFNNILSNNIFWKDKLFHDYRKFNMSSCKSWYDRYILASKCGNIVIGKKKIHNITLCTELDIKGYMLPYKGLNVIQLEKYIYYIDDNLSLSLLYKNDNKEYTSKVLHQDVTDIDLLNRYSIIYLKNGDIYTYNNKPKRLTKEGNIISLSSMDEKIYYLTNTGDVYGKYCGEDSKFIKNVKGGRKIITDVEECIILDKEGNIHCKNEIYKENITDIIGMGNVKNIQYTDGLNIRSMDDKIYTVNVICGTDSELKEKENDIGKVTIKLLSFSMLSFADDDDNHKTILHAQELDAKDACAHKLEDMKHIKYYHTGDSMNSIINYWVDHIPYYAKIKFDINLKFISFYSKHNIFII